MNEAIIYVLALFAPPFIIAFFSPRWARRVNGAIAVAVFLMTLASPAWVLGFVPERVWENVPPDIYILVHEALTHAGLLVLVFAALLALFVFAVNRGLISLVLKAKPPIDE